VRFVVDSSAGRLAKYLRALGFDTELARRVVDAGLLAEAERQGRILLTRKRNFGYSKPAFCRILASEEPREQLKQVLQEFPARPVRFGRCLVCNCILERVERSSARGRVPPYVFQTQKSFSHCPGCGRYYWEGTHWRRMNAFLDNIAAAGGE